jgi:hypothetical protein
VVEELDEELFEEKLTATHAELRSLEERAHNLEKSVNAAVEELLTREE